ncbi:hypothetical protein, partial [Burkholderia multivorans]|uniref:hypothetical protein n=1 Tax=Burkholderia multivorans TaxID=87883 RepID=UPI000DB4946A
PASRNSIENVRSAIAPGDAHGTDVDAQGYGTVTGQRLYQLVRQPGAAPSTVTRKRTGLPFAPGPST